MSSTAEVRTRIHDFLRREFLLAWKRGIGDEDKLLESEMIDSLGILGLVHFLEEEFSIHISDEELLPENFQTVARITEFVQRKMIFAAKPGAPTVGEP
jgi:acyl carrier protein